MTGLKFDIGASLSSGSLITKTKISNADSQQLHKLIKEEKLINKQLENKLLSDIERKRIEEERKKNMFLQAELSKKIADSQKLKLKFGDSDSWD